MKVRNTTVSANHPIYVYVLRYSASKKKTFWCQLFVKNKYHATFCRIFHPILRLTRSSIHCSFEAFPSQAHRASIQKHYSSNFSTGVGRTIKSVSANHKTAIEANCLVVSCYLCGQNEPGLHYRFCQCRGSSNLGSPCTCLLPQNHAPLCPESPARTRTRKLCIFVHSRGSWSGADVGQYLPGRCYRGHTSNR